MDNENLKSFAFSIFEFNLLFIKSKKNYDFSQLMNIFKKFRILCIEFLRTLDIFIFINPKKRNIIPISKPLLDINMHNAINPII